MENACAASLTDAARLVQLLKIDGYCTTITMGSNDCIKSRWSVDGYEWETRIYPNCRSSVVLELVSRSPSRTSTSVRANLGCRLVDPRGILKPSKEKCVSRTFLCSDTCSSELSLVTRSDLEASGYLIDDAITLRCTITVLKELPVQTFPAKEIPMPAVPSRSGTALELAEVGVQVGGWDGGRRASGARRSGCAGWRMGWRASGFLWPGTSVPVIQSGTGADVTLLVSGETFAAHKLVLAARSPVFMAEFFGQMVEKSSEHVEIEDMEAAVFKALLRFIYTDTAPEFDQKEEAGTVMAQHLLAAADRYGLDRLKLICEGRLSRGIGVNTVAATLALAEQHNCSQLKAKCIEFIVGTPELLDAVLATEGYKHLEASCPSVLTDLLARK